MRHIFLAAVFSAIAIAAAPAFADHGHGGHDGGGGHGGGWSGGHGGGWSGGHGGGWSGGHGVSFGHSGWGGGGSRFYGGSFYGSPFRSYYSYYRPYSYFYRPYSYGIFGYPYLYNYYSYPSSYYYGYPTYSYSYPSDYFANGSDYYAGNDYYEGSVDVDASPTRAYVVSRPVGDVARLEIRLPDPQATIWGQGKEIPSSGAVRQFKSPPLDPSHQYTYSIRCEWNNNGKVVSEEREVNVEPNGQSVVDFTRPGRALRDAGSALPDLPPPSPRPAG